MTPGAHTVGFVTLKQEHLLGETVVPWYVEAKMVLVLDSQSLDGQILGALCHGDLAICAKYPESRGLWMMLPTGSFVRHHQKREGRIKLHRDGWVIKEHPSYGILFNEFNVNAAKELLYGGLYLKLPLVKVVNTTEEILVPSATKQIENTGTPGNSDVDEKPASSSDTVAYRPPNKAADKAAATRLPAGLLKKVANRGAPANTPSNNKAASKAADEVADKPAGEVADDVASKPLDKSARKAADNAANEDTDISVDHDGGIGHLAWAMAAAMDNEGEDEAVTLRVKTSVVSNAEKRSVSREAKLIWQWTGADGSSDSARARQEVELAESAEKKAIQEAADKAAEKKVAEEARLAEEKAAEQAKKREAVLAEMNLHVRAVEENWERVKARVAKAEVAASAADETLERVKQEAARAVAEAEAKAAEARVTLSDLQVEEEKAKDLFHKTQDLVTRVEETAAPSIDSCSAPLSSFAASDEAKTEDPGDSAPPRKPSWPRPKLDGVSITGPWHVDDFRFFCDFDSGNCAGVVQSAASNTTALSFDVLVRADNQGTEFEALESQWFFFGMHGNFKKDQTLRFQVLGLSFFTKSDEGDKPKRSRLLVDGLKPMVSSSLTSSEWRFVKGGCDMRLHQDGSPMLTFEHQVRQNVEDEELYFSLFYPYPLAKLTSYLGDLERRLLACDNQIYVNRETLCSSLEGRPVELLAITEHRGASCDSQRQPPLKTSTGLPLRGCSAANARPLLFPERQAVFISARVHPGESPASYILEGLLDLLASNTSLSQKLLQRYVFHVIPCLNPDGVFLGHHRTDTRGENLNRVYGRSCADLHPSIFAAEAACLSAHQHQGGVQLYLDLHAHSSKRGIFFFGDDRNGGETLSRLYAYALARRFPLFEYSSSLFADRTPGTGKTAFADKIRAPLCFTLETNYRRGHHAVEAFGPTLWRQLGADCLRALSDFDDLKDALGPQGVDGVPVIEKGKLTWAARRLQAAYAWLKTAAAAEEAGELEPPMEMHIMGPSRAVPIFARVKPRESYSLGVAFGGDVTAGQIVELIDMQNVSARSPKKTAYGAKQSIFKLHECHGADVWLADADLDITKSQRGRWLYRTLSEVNLDHDIHPGDGNPLRTVSAGVLVEVEERCVVDSTLRLKVTGDGTRHWKKPGWASEFSSNEFDPRLGGAVQLMRVGYLYPSL